LIRVEGIRNLDPTLQEQPRAKKESVAWQRDHFHKVDA
jgi:hypothetical protein